MPLTFSRRFPPIQVRALISYFRLSSHELSEYVCSHFYDHLCAATTGFLHAQNISDNHPAVEILCDMEITAYYVDKNSSVYILRLARCIILDILRWADMLNSCLKVCAPYLLWIFF